MEEKKLLTLFLEGYRLDCNQRDDEIFSTSLMENAQITLKALVSLLFPRLFLDAQDHVSEQYISKKINTVCNYLKPELETLSLEKTALAQENKKTKLEAFIKQLSVIREELIKDAQFFYEGDPACSSSLEVMNCYPGFYAIMVYRLAHYLNHLGLKHYARLFTETAHRQTGIDIHPAAQIDSPFMIDHGTGVVIGQTTIIGKNVKLYQGVTLGALSVKNRNNQSKRHPTIEDDVTIYAQATILGGHTTIGKGSIIGGNVWLTKSIAPYTKITALLDQYKSSNIKPTS